MRAEPGREVDVHPYPTTNAERARWELARARAFARRLRAHDPAAPEPPSLPEGRIVSLPGLGETFCRVGPPVAGRLPVLLLHGWMASADLNWFRTYGPLGRDRQVIAIDHQGHGRGIRSEQAFSLERCADAAAGVLAHLGVERAIVAGYSMGGPIALHTWHRHPDLVAGLVLGATALEWRAHPIERYQWEVLRFVEAVLRFTTGKGVVQRVVRQAIDDDPTLEPLRPWLLGEMQRGYLPDIIAAGRALSRYDARPFATGIDVPVAVVHTRHDRLVWPRKQRQLAALTQASVHEIAADHDAPMVRADELNRGLLAAIADIEARLATAPVATAPTR